jgi:hypothetical protein
MKTIGIKTEPTILSPQNSKWLVGKLLRVDTSAERINKLRQQAQERLSHINLK